MLIITHDDLRPHTSTISKHAWTALLRNYNALLLTESELEDAMYMAGAPSSVILTPQPEAGWLQVDYQWVGDGEAGGDMSEFLRLAIIDCLIEATVAPAYTLARPLHPH